MIGYRDRTWCASKGCKNKCGRQFTEEDHKHALEWWGGEGYPLIIAHFCDENGELIER